MPTDFQAFLIAALVGLAGFTAWLLRDYLAYIKEQAGAWRQAAIKGVSTTEKAAKIALHEDE